MSIITKEYVASLLDGREIGEEILEGEEETFKQAGIVVLFGASDDLAELRGAIDDEGACCGGGDIFITADGKLIEDHEDCDCRYCGFETLKKTAFKIEAIWCRDGSRFSWEYDTTIPHTTFEINEGSDKYCKGIVFSLADLGEPCAS